MSQGVDITKSLPLAWSSYIAGQPVKSDDMLEVRYPWDGSLTGTLSKINSEQLEQAIQSTKPHGRVIVASWYGSQKTPLSLNTHFHRGRLRIVSSQVSSIAPELRGLWSHQRRMQQAIHLLGEFPYDALSAQRIPFTQAPDSYPPLFSDGSQSLHPYFEYNKD